MDTPTHLTPAIWSWALERIGERSQDEDCVDSLRAALADDPNLQVHFDDYATCCGSSEWEEVGPDGRTYVLGFNYGH